MLAALLQNNNNARQQQPGFKVDPRASAGRSRPSPIDSDRGPSEPRGPSYDIADILAAAAIFPEIASEDPATRAVRRLRWISEALPFIKATREKSEAAAFLAGIQLGAATMRAEIAASEKFTIEQLIQIIDEVRGTQPSAPVLSPPVPIPVSKPKPAPVPVPHGRGATAKGLGGVVIALGLLIGGVMIGSRISDPRRKRRW
jgi:hypothetical protein